MKGRKQHQKLEWRENVRRSIKMQPELGNGSPGAGTHDPAEQSLFATLARIERDLNDLTDALALLGVKRCSQCRKFLRCADPGALFDCGQLVCYGCIPDWWSSQSMRLDRKS